MINIFFNDKGEDLQSLINNLLLEIYKKRYCSNSVSSSLNFNL